METEGPYDQERDQRSTPKAVWVNYAEWDEPLTVDRGVKFLGVLLDGLGRDKKELDSLVWQLRNLSAQETNDA